jgi:hypothetical protein
MARYVALHFSRLAVDAQQRVMLSELVKKRDERTISSDRRIEMVVS